MKGFGFVLFLALIAAAVSIVYLGASSQSPDSLLLFSRYNQETQSKTIYLFNATTGEEKKITDILGFGDAGWTTDGRIWIVDALTDSESRLRLFDAHSHEESIIPTSLSPVLCVPPLIWLPDKQHYAYFTGEESETLTIANLENEPLYTIPDASQYELSWSPDGAYLLTRPNLLRTSDGSELLSFARNSDQYNRSFSPDSRLFAYESDGLIHLYTLATGETTQLENTGKIDSWSPTGRYLLLRGDSVVIDAAFIIYDTQTGEEKPLAWDTPLRPISWNADESAFLFYTNYQDEEPRTLVRYDVASDTTEIVFDTEGWIGSVYEQGAWLAIRYSDSPPDPDGWINITDQLLIRRNETEIEAELLLDVGGSIFTNAPNHTWSPNGRWLSLSSNGIYIFDTETGILEALAMATENPNALFWSPDSRYLAIANGQMLWNTRSKTMESLPPSINQFIGWQNGAVQDSLLYCGIG